MFTCSGNIMGSKMSVKWPGNSTLQQELLESAFIGITVAAVQMTGDELLSRPALLVLPGTVGHLVECMAARATDALPFHGCRVLQCRIGNKSIRCIFKPRLGRGCLNYLITNVAKM